ncbi:MAG: hypothetical protein N4A50_12915 [Vallitalea sp.]|jgi:hypothetical protein|nr:hypothetical protein [Vallitalea sp.]
MDNRVIKDYKDTNRFTDRACQCWEELYIITKCKLSNRFLIQELHVLLDEFDILDTSVSLIDLIAFDLSLDPDRFDFDYDEFDIKLRELSDVESIFMIEWMNNYKLNKDHTDIESYINDFINFY